MKARMRTYTAYSVGGGIVWAIRLVLASLLDPPGKRKNTFLVFSRAARERGQCPGAVVTGAAGGCGAVIR